MLRFFMNPVGKWSKFNSNLNIFIRTGPKETAPSCFKKSLVPFTYIPIKCKGAIIETLFFLWTVMIMLIRIKIMIWPSSTCAETVTYYI